MGQVNRVDSCRLAVARAGRAGAGRRRRLGRVLPVPGRAGDPRSRPGSARSCSPAARSATRTSSRPPSEPASPCTSPAPGTSSTDVAFWVVVTFLAGAALAGQARMNGELATRLGHGLDAAVWSFGSGLAALTLVLAFSPRMRDRVRFAAEGLARPRVRWWQCIGGVIGGLFVSHQAYAVPIAGVALFTIAVVGAQTLTAVGVDKLGIGPAGRCRSPWRGSPRPVLAIVGVVVAVGGRVSGSTAAVVVPAILAAVVGAAATVQQGINGRVTVAAHSPMTTTWLNFATGTATLLVLAVPRRAVRVVRAAGDIRGALVGVVRRADRDGHHRRHRRRRKALGRAARHAAHAGRAAGRRGGTRRARPRRPATTSRRSSWSGCSSRWGPRHWPAWPQPAPPDGRAQRRSPTRPWQDSQS